MLILVQTIVSLLRVPKCEVFVTRKTLICSYTVTMHALNTLLLAHDSKAMNKDDFRLRIWLVTLRAVQERGSV